MARAITRIFVHPAIHRVRGGVQLNCSLRSWHSWNRVRIITYVDCIHFGITVLLFMIWVTVCKKCWTLTTPQFQCSVMISLIYALNNLFPNTERILTPCTFELHLPRSGCYKNQFHGTFGDNTALYLFSSNGSSIGLHFHCKIFGRVQCFWIGPTTQCVYSCSHLFTL